MNDTPAVVDRVLWQRRELRLGIDPKKPLELVRGNTSYMQYGRTVQLAVNLALYIDWRQK